MNKSTWTVLCVLTRSWLVLSIHDVRLRTFTVENSCNLQQRIESGCAELKQGSFKSLLACTSVCRDSCTGVVWKNNSSCYVYKPCSTPIACGVSTFRMYRKENPCRHGSQWNKTTDTCKCIDGWVGERCERLPVHCRELREYGYPTGFKNRLWVKLDLDSYHQPVDVRCDVFNTMENTIVMHSKGQLDNNNTWDDYVRGFIRHDPGFWLGLEKIKALNDAGLDLLVLTAGFDGENTGYTRFEQSYYGFKMGNESAGFSFDFEETMVSKKGVHANVTDQVDCLGPLRGGLFSTWDEDNDEDDTHNCAAEAGTGWWFKGCDMVCNPLGWSYKFKPGPETKSHVKMAGIDFAAYTYAKSANILMYFQSWRK